MHDRKRQLLLDLLFFLVCTVYLWVMVKPHLIYHGFGTLILNVPQFSTGWQYLKHSLEVPGGLVVYAYGFLSLWYADSWLGTLIIVGVALSLCELSKRHYTYTGHSKSTILHYAPAIMILLIYNQYDHPLAACLTVCAGLLFSYILESLPLHRRLIRLCIFCVMATFIYWIAGSGGIFVFSIMTTVYLLFLRRDWLSAVLTLPVSVAIMWALAEYVFYISPNPAFTILTPWSRDLTTNMNPVSQMLIVTLYALVPVTVLLQNGWRILSSKRQNTRTTHPKKTQPKKAGTVNWLQSAFPGHVKKLVIPAVPVAILAVGLYATYNKPHRLIVLMNYQAREKQWSDVLETANHLPKTLYNICANHHINRALYHTDQLGKNLFCFRQNPHALLLTHEPQESFITQLIMCDTFMDMGNVDDAEKLASEFLVDKGQAGIILEKLAWINIIKGQKQTARVYLNALKKDLNYRDRADTMLSQLKHGFEPDEAAYIRRIRACRRTQSDATLYKASIEDMLTGLIKHNPSNKMAFEYLMTYYLLTGQTKKAAETIGYAEGLAYQAVPTLYEEATLLYHALRSQKLNLKTLNIRRGTFERYKQFVTLCNALKGSNRQAVQQQLTRQFGTSYFFYYTFELSRLTETPQG